MKGAAKKQSSDSSLNIELIRVDLLARIKEGYEREKAQKRALVSEGKTYTGGKRVVISNLR